MALPGAPTVVAVKSCPFLDWPIAKAIDEMDTSTSLSQGSATDRSDILRFILHAEGTLKKQDVPVATKNCSNAGPLLGLYNGTTVWL